MIKNRGFSLIELIVFIVVLSIASATIAITAVFSLRNTPIQHNQSIAINTADKCMEYYLGQRYLKGFNFNALTCPGSPEDTPSSTFCNNLTPSGFTTSITIECASVPSMEEKVKLIQVETVGSVSGAALLKMLITEYDEPELP